MNYWLVKSDPDEYGIEQFAKDKVTAWTGVRNYLARNNMKAMKVGDKVLFYHSQAEPPAIVGFAEVGREAYPDATQFEKGSKHFDAKSSKENPRWFCVDLKFQSLSTRQVSLPAIKQKPGLAQMELLKASRLSVQRVTAAEFKIIEKLSE